MSGRNNNGQFAPGNPGGPGRPRRNIEQEYLAVLSDTVSLNDWKEVVLRALADARAGDAKARDWLTQYLIGEQPPKLIDVAEQESRGRTAEDAIGQLARRRKKCDEIDDLMSS